MGRPNGPRSLPVAIPYDHGDPIVALRPIRHLWHRERPPRGPSILCQIYQSGQSARPRRFCETHPKRDLALRQCGGSHGRHTDIVHPEPPEPCPTRDRHSPAQGQRATGSSTQSVLRPRPAIRWDARTDHHHWSEPSFVARSPAASYPVRDRSFCAWTNGLRPQALSRRA